MAYIGKEPADSFISFAKQDFTTSATTSYTLDNAVTNENELALFINFVRQEPTTAYTASGTSLTLTSATSSSDDMYCIYLGKAVQTVNPPSGSVGISQLSATGTKDATTFLRGDNTFASAGGDNTPAFMARLSSTQSLTNATNVKIQFDTEEYDTDSIYDNSTNYRFTVPSGGAGKYVIYYNIFLDGNAVNGLVRVDGMIYKNGSIIALDRIDPRNSSVTKFTVGRSMTLNLSVADYIEIYGFADSSSTPDVQVTNSHDNIFGAYKLIGV